MSSYPPSILYIHGLNSSPLSQKASHLSSALERLGQAERLRVPALHHHPRQAIGQLETCLAELGRPLLVGSSLGGYYATHLAERHGLKALLINPAVMPHRRFDGYLGPQTNLYSGEVWELEQAVAIMGDSQLGRQLNQDEVSAITAFLRSVTGDQPQVAYPVLPASTADTPKPQ